MPASLRRAPALAESVAQGMQPFRPVPMPVDVEDAEAFPEIARAIAGLADLSPERRAELDAEWRDA